jgi:hypothetical protein
MLEQIIRDRITQYTQLADEFQRIGLNASAEAWRNAISILHGILMDAGIDYEA